MSKKWQPSRGFWLPPFLIDGQVVRMCPLERDMFAVLYNARGGIVTLDEMNAAMWNSADGGPDDSSRARDVHMCRLRQKLSRTRFRIVNVFGHGYRMERVTQATVVQMRNLQMRRVA